jgi:acyl CoA:acetate/3-ketoacid CoA transferase alpha subunit
MTEIASDPDDLVARFIAPGEHVHLAMTPSRPNAVTYALARWFAGRHCLTVSMAAVHSAAHALTLSGAVDQMITGFLGDTFPVPRPNLLYRDLVSGAPFQAEVWSLLSLTQRLVAGAMGLPHAVTNSLRGSDLATGKSLTDLTDAALIPALRPDVTVLHGICADRRGNVVLVKPLGEGAWSAYGAKHGVLASVERIVPDTLVDRFPDHVVVPGTLVRAVCEAPGGAHPQSLRTANFAGIEGYAEDRDFLSNLADRGRSRADLERWYQEWVVEVGDHAGYIKKLRERSPRPRRQPSPVTASGSSSERTIVLGARAVEDLVVEHGYRTLLAGIGPSHLAAWMAADSLRRRGLDVRVCTELGFYGQRPSSGDVFLFSAAHRSEGLSGLVEVLGGLAGASGRCLGVLSTAEVDPFGNLNTCLLPDGRWITGSGGANDIVSTTDTVVVATASQRSYVSRVAHVTSPGHRVREVVCQSGRFRRRGSRLYPATRLPGTDLDVSPDWLTPTEDCVAEAEITAAELAALRLIDPEGFYR